jgi:hypothetical protein
MVLKGKGIFKRVAGTFSGCCKQRIATPSLFPNTSAAKICIKKGGA